MASPFAYFDYAATTPTDPRVISEMLPYFGLDGDFGNPSSLQHKFGIAAANAVEHARRHIALATGTRPGEVIWTSGATEANNLAIRGILSTPTRQARRLITQATEHPAVLDTARAVRQGGAQVEILPVNRKGLIDLDQLHRLVAAEPALVSIMWVNNETGVTQPIADIAHICRTNKAILHVDATQAAGKIAIDVRRVPLDLMSLSAHKIYGPKGVGALIVRRGIKLQPMVTGGGQERGLRPGTIPTPLIVGMGKAFEIMRKDRKADTQCAVQWNKRIASFVSNLGEAVIHGDPNHRVPHIISVSFGGISGDLVSSLTRVAVSNGSACATHKVAPSHVLMGMGLSRAQALSTIRISLGRFTTEDSVELLLAELGKAVANLRGTAR